MDALARAKEVAARLSGLGGSAPGASDGELGKRKSRGWGEDNLQGNNPLSGLGGSSELKKKKIYVPSIPGVNFLGLVIGPRGATQKRLSEVSGVKRLVLRGRGSQRGESGPPEDGDDDDLHVLLEGTDEAIERASNELQILFNNPEEAMRLKGEQLRNLAEIKGINGDNSYGSVSASGGGGMYGGQSNDASATEGGFQMRVPNNLVGSLIGKGGENIQRMQLQTGGRIHIPKESEMRPGETFRTITLTGPPAAIPELQRRIDDIIQSRLSMNSGMSGYGASGVDSSGGQRKQQKEMDHSFILKVPVPNDKIGIIIGKGGTTIKSIQERTRTTVQIPSEPDQDNAAVRTISIGADTQESVIAAQLEIHQTLQQCQQMNMNMGGGTSGQMGGMGGNTTMIYVHVPDECVGSIIGKGGSTIKDINNRLRVKVMVPQTADPSLNPPMRVLQISGSHESAQQAKEEIEAIVANNNAQRFSHQGASSSYYGGGNADPYSYNNFSHAPSSGGETQDLTQYYSAYWTYAAHYGEKAARLYYGAWSPPEGTQPPPGIVVAPDIELPGVSSTTDTTSYQQDSGSTASTVSTTGAEPSEQLSDEMIEYRKNYRVWWEQHGRAHGAPEEPPL